MTGQPTSRRRFIQQLSATAALPLLGSCLASPHPRGAGEVVLARDPLAAKDLSTIDEPRVHKLVDRAIQHFTGRSKTGAAWAAIFPRLDRDTTIGIKVNCVAGNRPRQLCTQLATVRAIINGLAQMSVGGKSFPLGK